MGEWFIDTFFGWIYDIFYTLQKSICYLLDFIRDIFCKLAGIETVKIDGSEEEILSHFITSPAIRNAFLGVLLVGVILLFVFVIIAIIKSEAADPQHKKTKGQILVKSLQSFIIFLLIPFLLIAGIMLANVVVGAIHASMTGSMLDGNTASTIGGQILVTSGYDAYIGPAGSRAEIERMFVTGQLDYNSLSVVKRYYDLSEMNFFVGIAGGLVILVMFVMSAVMFVQRIFDINPFIYRIAGVGIDDPSRRRRQVPYMARNARVKGSLRLRHYPVNEYLFPRRAANLANIVFRQRL